jgi:hypothetical protein
VIVMPARPDPHAVIEAGDGEIHEARSAVHDDGQARVDIAGEDDASAVEAASGVIVEADSGLDSRDDDLRYGRSLPAQQAVAAQSAAQTTATTTAEPDARNDATLPAPRKLDDPAPAETPVVSEPDKADEALNPYLTPDAPDTPDPAADTSASGDDATASE